MMTMYIDHMPNAVSVRAALTESDVRTRATRHVETRDERVIASISHALQHTPETNTHAGADLRYRIAIRDDRGEVTTVYLDAFGLRGVVNGRPVRFANDAIKRAIVRAFPNLAQ